MDMKLLEGKKCLVMGVLNEKSIAWGIVQEMANQGAELCMTYLGDAGKKRVVPLAEKLGCNYTLPCDVSNEEDIENGITFTEFYNEFKEILIKYNNPSIVVWGKNDILALKACYDINDLTPLTPNFINLLQVHKNYFNLKNDLGLFNAYKNYTGKDLDQEHDALVDAFMTKNVFFEFKKEANKKMA